MAANDRQLRSALPRSGAGFLLNLVADFLQHFDGVCVQRAAPKDIFDYVETALSHLDLGDDGVLAVQSLSQLALCQLCRFSQFKQLGFKNSVLPGESAFLHVEC